MLLIYAVAVSVMYYIEYTNRNKYQYDFYVKLQNKEKDLNERDKVIINKEICAQELTKLKTVHNSLYTIISDNKAT